MKSSTAVFILLSIVIFLFSCSKEEVCPENKKFTIEGNLYVDCSKIPLEGVPLELIQNAPTGLNYGGLLDTFTTDSSGYFKFDFPQKKGMELFIRYAGEGSNTIISGIPKDTSVFGLDLYMHPTVNIEVYLNVINPYTSFDTLLIDNKVDFEGIRIPGPFKSGFAFKSDQIFLFDMSWAINAFKVGYVILPYRGFSYSSNFSIREYCDNTVKVTLDIE